MSNQPTYEEREVCGARVVTQDKGMFICDKSPGHIGERCRDTMRRTEWWGAHAPPPASASDTHTEVNAATRRTEKP